MFKEGFVKGRVLEEALSRGVGSKSIGLSLNVCLNFQIKELPIGVIGIC